MVTLFRHNQVAYEAASEMMRETGKAAVIHPTGTGKSFIGFKLCEDNQDKTVLWLSPSEYIFKTQLKNWEAAGGEEPQNVRFFTYAKLMNMSEEEISEIKPKIAVFDEFHRAGATLWQLGVQRFLKLFPEVPVLGLTATAIRYLDNQRDMADELFDGNIASEMTLGEAIVRGILNPPQYITAVYSYQKDMERYQRKVQSLRSKSQREKAEKYLEALRRALEKADGLDVIFPKYMTDTHGKYIVFCSSKEHMDEMMNHTEWFRQVDENPRIYSVYSDDPAASASFGAFRADNQDDHLRLLYCIDALNEGIHVEGVSGVILLRPTISPIIYKQQIGRALSASKAREPVIFDIVNNIAGLYSISTIQEEMQEFLKFNRFLGQEGTVVNERFQLIDAVENCRHLFDELEETLSASWDFMYAEAKAYYKENGDLLPTSDYLTPNGARLGKWIVTQRINYRNGMGISPSRIERLNKIGMNWKTLHERQWDERYALAVQYYNKYGDLRPNHEKYPKLANWLVKQRRKQRDGLLEDDHFEMLSALGMIWDFEDEWEQKFELARTYFEEHGNLDIPATYKTKDGVCLGAWYRGIRNQFKDGTLTEERRRKLESIGIQWESVLERTWAQFYELAKQYYSEHGNLNVRSNYETEDGVKLGTWIAGQRYSKKKNRLSEEQIRLLDEIGMSWQRFESKWDTAYGYAKTYFDMNRTVDVPSTYITNDGFKLGVWMAGQRKKYAAGKLKPMQIKRLEALQITWDLTDESWRRGYAHAEAYFKANGDLNVTGGYKSGDGYKLGVWIANQRTAYRQNRLTDEKIQKLKAIGMHWSVLHDRWQTGYEHAKAFFERYGNLNVPKTFACEDGYPLCEWVKTQRSAYRDGKLSEEREQLLREIGMIWNMNDSRWDEVYEMAREYYREHGDLNVPTRCKAADGSDLWEWIRSQREKYKNGTLSAECIRKLEKIGIDWLSVQEREWETYYDEAKKYYLAHGHLDVPISLRVSGGLWLGRWVARQRSRKNRLKTSGPNGNQIKRLEMIGMQWETQNLSQITQATDSGPVAV